MNYADPKDRFAWFPGRGYGYLHPSLDFSYDDAYIENFEEMGSTDQGGDLNSERVSFVEGVLGDEDYEILDFGVGGLNFLCLMRAMGWLVKGYDIAPRACRKLREKNWFHNPYEDDGEVEVATFWDSLEHVEDPKRILKRVTNFCFVTIPVFTSGEQALESHHFKPNEHIHHWTDWGFVLFMKKQGWELIEQNRMEEEHGRRDVATFAFRRA